MDTIHRRMGAVQRDILTAIDERTSCAMALAVPRANSRHSARFFTLCARLMPFPAHRVITDNGAEFQPQFARLLKTAHIRHLHTWPKTPKMNAGAECFNRTPQEEFVDYQEQLLFTGFAFRSAHTICLVRRG